MKFFIMLISISIAVLLEANLSVYASSLSMRDPHFWINKIRDPNRLLLTLSEIEKINEENLKKQNLLLCKVEGLKEEWSQEEIVAFLKEDWKSFGKSEQVRYGKQKTPLNDSFWKALKENIDQGAIKEKSPLLFGFTVRRTDIRVFPTDEISTIAPVRDSFDMFQHSAIGPGSLIGIYHFSRDKLWAYAQTPFIRGWIRTKDLALARDRNEALAGESKKPPLVITGNFVRVFADPLFAQPVFFAQMGSVFPILHLHGPTGAAKPYYTIRLPFREADGRLAFQLGYISSHSDTHHGFLPYTQKNLAQQAFKMLHEPYGWGEKNGGRDCSRFIMDIFNTFGILMPRNSTLQAKMGISLGSLEGKTSDERNKILDGAIPLATLLRMPGHIMLYLGKHEGKHYAIHSIWGVQKRGPSGIQTHKIGKVVVTDLDLGKEGPNGSLLERLTEIQFIGLDLGPIR